MIQKRNIFRIAAVLTALLLIAGCAGIQPYNSPNHREEGPAKGLFTGAQGAWVIVGPKASPTSEAESKDGQTQSETDREHKKNPEESSDGVQ